MADPIGKLYMVIRPDDRRVVPLTCTPQQLKEVWLAEGYELAPAGAVMRDIIPKAKAPKENTGGVDSNDSK